MKIFILSVLFSCLVYEAAVIPFRIVPIHIRYNFREDSYQQLLELFKDDPIRLEIIEKAKRGDFLGLKGDRLTELREFATIEEHRGIINYLIMHNPAEYHSALCITYNKAHDVVTGTICGTVLY